MERLCKCVTLMASVNLMRYNTVIYNTAMFLISIFRISLIPTQLSAHSQSQSAIKAASLFDLNADGQKSRTSDDHDDHKFQFQRQRVLGASSESRRMSVVCLKVFTFAQASESAMQANQFSDSGYFNKKYPNIYFSFFKFFWPYVHGNSLCGCCLTGSQRLTYMVVGVMKNYLKKILYNFTNMLLILCVKYFFYN